MTLLVTGGAGFIGSNFIFHLRRFHPEYRIICLDKLTYAGHLSTLEAVLHDPQFRFIKGDICDAETVQAVFAQEHPEIVVHFAAQSHVDRSIADPDETLRTNIFGTQTLLDACRAFGIRRFHQISTDEVYGDVPLDSTDPGFAESAPLRPSSPYSSSKAGSDLLVLAYHRTYGLPVTISRSSNNYGPYQYPEKLIPCMIRNCLQSSPLPVYGSGMHRRDWLHVADHCHALDLVLHSGKDGEIYNIAAHQELCNLDVVRLICRELGKPESCITSVPDRKGHDLRYAIDTSKIRDELGWSPQIPAIDGIRRTVRWYLEHRSWWEAFPTES